MPDQELFQVAIVDCGMGNLFNVRRACEHVGLPAAITASPADVRAAAAIILPGVGAFGDAMAALSANGLVGTLREYAASGRPLVGICLGMQLLMDESSEFGRHQGLGIIPGSVVRLEDPTPGQEKLKVPQVGWNRMFRAQAVDDDTWGGSLLSGLPDGVFMYFGHSYHVIPDDPALVVAMTEYGGIRFCSALQQRNIFACQGHPERSGEQGLQVYRNLSGRLAALGK